MHKPARTMPAECRVTINSINQSFKGKSLEEQLSEFATEHRGDIRGLNTRVRGIESSIRQIHDQLCYLTNLLTAIETGVRTSRERREAMAGYVEGCGRGADDGAA
jgi:uncharacterized coiled-coil protein SlyX